ncbi:hypothetical protein KVR01_007480 [Diaporthe batatas]|uniref:uncharacterized protein n=1 Tax=Diaporthe batatas TaxID=748121 RepID=UPI001D04E5BA|nr:uncharacterized protein KVR01_007480 [Diaporthe batatas]KAG8163002.1 hypothetical protein KVR01_007480 [Diaporthe batatas]
MLPVFSRTHKLEFQTLRQFLGSHGDIACGALRIESSCPTTTQGVVVRTEHRLDPTTIRPWTDFEQQQAVLAAERVRDPFSLCSQAGLAGNSRTLDMRRDVWERDHEDLHDFMIRKRTKYGYISTSDTFIFLRLEQHTPSIVEYYTVRRPQPGSSLPPEIFLALLSAADTRPCQSRRQHTLPYPRQLKNCRCPIAFEQALFCTTKCILDVVMGRPMDANCPNKHGHQHPSAADFRQALREQLSRSSSGRQHLWLGWSGSASSLFKVRLASLGYVIVAKATSTGCRLAEDEEHIYTEYLRPAQEIGVFGSLLLLGCVPGQPIVNVAPLLTQSSPSASSTADPDDGHASLPHQQEPAKQPLAAVCRAAIQTAFGVIHRLGVLHGKAGLRNIILLPRGSTSLGQVVLVDFGNAMLCDEWWESVRRKRARKRRHRKQARLQQQDASIADQQADFQVACRREMLRCLDELERICI